MRAMDGFPAPGPPARRWPAHPPAGGPPVAAGSSFRRILVPVDSWGRCAPALTAAAALSTAVGGLLRLVHVRTWEPPIRAASRFFYETSGEATTLLEDSLSEVWAAGVTASGVIVDAQRSRAAAAIAGEARTWGAEVIVIARRRRTLPGVLLLGSLSQDVMRAASCPVLVVRPGRVTGASHRPAVR